MYRQAIKIILIGVASSLSIYAEVDMQQGVYDAAEEMIRFDEKMNRAIAEHNQMDMEEENTIIEDFEETENGYLLQQEIPQNDNTKINVELKDGMITITTTTTEKEAIESEAITGYETTMSSSSLSLFIPHDADENRMEKDYENGVLKITFPKKEH